MKETFMILIDVIKFMLLKWLRLKIKQIKIYHNSEVQGFYFIGKLKIVCVKVFI